MNNNNWYKRKFLTWCIVGTMAAVLLVGVYGLSRIIADTIVGEKIEETSIHKETNIMIGIEDIQEGDAGISDMPTWDITTPLKIPKENGTKMNMIKLAVSYNEKIPYQEDGFCWTEGYPIFSEGIDSRFVPEDTSLGVSSLGYCIWIYRNIFGNCDSEFLDPTKMYEKYAIKKEELQIGDIGMYALEGANHYGVCIGYDNGYPVFTHCDSIPKGKYPGGCNKLAYLKDGDTPFYTGNRPVEFNYFFRPNVTWER